MRKRAAFVTAALVLALAAPVGAASVTVNGDFESRFTLYRDETTEEMRVRGESGTVFQAELEARLGDNLRAVIELVNIDDFAEGEDDEQVPVREFGAAYPAWPTTIGKVFLEAEGSFWDGGPVARTTVGDTEMNFSEWIAHLGDRRGIKVEEMQLGPGTLGAFYAWEEGTETPEERPHGLRYEGSVDGLDGAITILRRGDATDVAVDAGMEVWPGVRVDGTVALDSQQTRAYQVDVTAAVLPRTTLQLGYRDSRGFAAMYPELDEDTNDPVAYDGLAGAKVGFETLQRGVYLKASYDLPSETTELAAETELNGYRLWGEAELTEPDFRSVELGVERTFDLQGAQITGIYTGTVPFEGSMDMLHELEVKGRTNAVPSLQGLELDGKVTYQGGVTTWEAGASYDAPNGISLGTRYHSQTGPSVTGGIKVTF